MRKRWGVCVLLVVSLLAGLSPASGAEVGAASDLRARIADGVREVQGGRVPTTEELREAARVLRDHHPIEAAMAEQLANQPASTRSWPPDLGHTTFLVTNYASQLVSLALYVTLFSVGCLGDVGCHTTVITTFATQLVGVSSYYALAIAIEVADEGVGAAFDLLAMVDPYLDVVGCVFLIGLPDIFLLCVRYVLGV